MSDFKELELLNNKLKSMITEVIAQTPIILRGCDSPFFFEQVGYYLINSESTIDQKQQFMKAFSLDRCVNYENKVIIESYVNEMKHLIKCMQLNE